MACTVFANGMGFFHKGSGGTGVAFPDVCLSPPPPPAGPVPIPYPNNIQASDLANGSKTVKIEGQPTALKNDSYVATSTGDEGGTQGGNVVTHKIKGKGYFKLWSFDVKVEGKNVDRHGDMMGQNCASDPPGGIDPSAIVTMAVAEAKDPEEPCSKPYSKANRHGSPTSAQKAAVQGGPCWECGGTAPSYIADHQPPCLVVYYAGGCHDAAEQEKKVKDVKAVKPHCGKCSSRQGGLMSAFSKTLRAAHGL